MSSKTEEMFNRKKEEEEDDEARLGGMWKAAAVATTAGIGIAALAWGVSKLLASNSEEEEELQDNRKMMKAPGRNGQLIYRDDFQRDPSAHFRQLRNERKSEKSKLFGSDLEEEEPQDNREMMKAPGRNGQLIYRDDFVQSPSDYFRQLRNDRKSEKSTLFGSDSEEEEPQDNRKMMKAPGRNGDLIYRDDFVQSPSSYFRQLRNDRKSEKSKLFGSDSEEEEPQDNRKMMKAPGRNGDLIYRDDFVQSPSDYFRQLRSDTRSQK